MNSHRVREGGSTEPKPKPKEINLRHPTDERPLTHARGTHVNKLSYLIKTLFNTLARLARSCSVRAVRFEICLLYGRTAGGRGCFGTYISLIFPGEAPTSEVERPRRSRNSQTHSSPQKAK